MRDFSIKTFALLLNKLLDAKYTFQTFTDFITAPQERTIILRHDIDLKKRSSLDFAKIESRLNIKGTFYFRAVKKIFDPEIIKAVAELHHEIGYHYEDLSLHQGIYSKAIWSFENNLSRFRKIYPVKTICMHGNSLSKFDNKMLWQNINYQNYGIIGEPYFDIDFNKVLYLTDSAQRWNGNRIAVRDKVTSKYDYSFTTTFDIMNNISQLPNQLMITIHPDRWTNNLLEWYRIQAVVRVKNLIKINILSKRAQVFDARKS